MRYYADVTTLSSDDPLRLRALGKPLVARIQACISPAMAIFLYPLCI